MYLHFYFVRSLIVLYNIYRIKQKKFQKTFSKISGVTDVGNDSGSSGPRLIGV